VGVTDSSGVEEVEVLWPRVTPTQDRVAATQSWVTTTWAGKKIEEEKLTQMDVNMVFMILAEFCAPTEDIRESALGAKHAMFEKPENPGAHMKPLFIRVHLDGTPIRHMLMDGGASINILPLSLFKKLIHIEGDLKRTNLSLSGFAGDPTETKGIICKELMVGSKNVPMGFFMQGGKMKCLTDRDSTGYDYVSIGKDGFVLISVKPAIDVTWLAHDLV
jgi:hypothetical protein